MKYLQVKIFNDDNCYFVVIEKIKFKNNLKVIEQDFYKTFMSLTEIQYYLTNILNTLEFRKNKIFINYIGNEVLIETINTSSDIKLNIKNELNTIYPKYQLDYSLFTGEIKLNSKNKKVVCALLNHEIIKNLKNLISFVGKKEIYFGIDILMLQCFINKNFNIFNKKYILLIQKNYHFYRIHRILNGKIINYIVLNDEKETFLQMYKSIIDNVNGKIDEVIFEGDYSVYQELIDKFFQTSVVLIDYIDNIKNLDERKLVYAKNKI